MRTLVPLVPVESHRRERAERVAVPVPEVGLRWGKPADLTFETPPEEAEARRRAGLVIRWPAGRRHTVLIHDVTPVWRRFDAIRVRSESDPGVLVDATMTREVLIPIGETRQKFVSLGTGYVEDTGGATYEERVIHTYLHLKIPPPITGGEKVDEGEEGAWLSYPQEIAPPGRIGGVMTWQTQFGSGFGWHA